MIARSERYVDRIQSLHERIGHEIHLRNRMRKWMILSWTITGVVIVVTLILVVSK